VPDEEGSVEGVGDVDGGAAPGTQIDSIDADLTFAVE
jgi:hypothetical protein